MVKRFFKTLLHYLRPPRRISFTREGLIFTLFTFPVGLAAINTGNNMLYLVLGMLLSLIAVNGFLSESSVKGITVSSRIPDWVFAGDRLLSFAELTNHKQVFPSYLLRIKHIWGEKDIKCSDGFCIKIFPQESSKTRLISTIPHRGVFSLKGFQLATRFPFGLFIKSRDIKRERSITVYPRPLPVIQDESQVGGIFGEVEQNVRGMGGDLYALRDYHLDDDARHIHWKVTAKVGHPILREYSASGRKRVLINFDTSIKPTQPQEDFETAVSKVSFLVKQAFEYDMEIGLLTAEERFDPERGGIYFHKIMRYLAIIKPQISPKKMFTGQFHEGEGQVFFIQVESKKDSLQENS